MLEKSRHIKTVDAGMTIQQQHPDEEGDVTNAGNVTHENSHHHSSHSSALMVVIFDFLQKNERIFKEQKIVTWESLATCIS